MRKRVKVVMFIVAAAFIGGFLLSELWQLIRYRERGGRRQIIASGVGQVDKQTIGLDEYRQVREFIAQKYRKDSLFRDLTNEDEARIDHLAWDYLIQEMTWNKVLRESRLGITDGELEWIITRFPPPALQNRPDLMTDGKFDTTKYLQALQNPQNRPFFAQYAREIYEQLRPQKLQMYVAGALLLSEGEIEDVLTKANTVASVTALYIGPGALTEEEKKFEPTEAQMRAYYRDHQKDYQPKEEVRELRFVFFPFSVTAQDSAAAKERIDEAYRRLLGADPASIRDSFKMVSYTFGDFEPETTSVAFNAKQFFPATESVVRRLKPGRFSPPVVAENGWQIIFLDSARNDTFWVRRIRTRIRPDDTRELAQRDEVKNFIDQATAENFDSVATRLGLTIAPTPARVVGKKRLNWAVEIYNPSQLIEWAREAKLGDILDIPLRGPHGFYAFQLAKIVPVQPAPFERVKEAVRWKVRQEEQKKLWRKKAQEAVAAVRAGKTLEQYAAENTGAELIQEVVNGIYDYRARGQRGVEFVAAALALEPGETAGPIETGWGCYVIRSDSKNQAEPPVLTAEKYIEQKNQRLFQELWQKLTEEPESRDLRLFRGY
ncbi:MAG: peptidyl-prolyl cis-trans isomerase [bacterium]